EIAIACVAAGIERAVINGNLAYGAGPTQRQHAARRGLAKQSSRDGGACLYARAPEFQNGGDMRERPWQHKRTSCEEQQHDRLSGGGHFFEQLLLPAAQYGMR